MNSDQNQENIQAWNHLYEKTEGNIWGTSPLPFLLENLGQMNDLLGGQDDILDAGTGEGRNLPALLQLKATLWACDASKNALKRIPRSLKEKVSTCCCDLTKTPYDNHQFQLITLLDVFETLPDVESVLSELYRILKPNGYLFVNIPDSSDSISNKDMKPLINGGFLYANKYYYRFYAESEVLELIHNAKFHIQNQNKCTWEEDPHENYRDQEHTHTSTVYLLQKNN